MKLFITLAFAALSVCWGELITLWPTSLDETENDSHLRRTLTETSGLPHRFSTVSHAHFFTAAADIYRQMREGEEIEFGVPSALGRMERKACSLRSGHPVVPKALAERFSTLKFFHCITRDGSELRIVFNSNRRDGLSASFFDARRGRTYYVDNALEDSDHYVIYDAAIAAAEGIRPEFIDSQVIYPDLPVFEFNDDDNSKRMLQGTNDGEFNAYKFRMAPLTHKSYSSFHKNTYETVLAALIECFSRVNGIYLRETGIFFELIENADRGICLEGDSRAACNRVSNSVNVLYSAASILEDLGVSSSEYDIGHAFTTGSGGAAYLGVLCSRNKAGGTTGLREPTNDIYFVDYVAHEIGHQMAGNHIYRDCSGPTDGQLSTKSAVEPGSGSTIMGYAGICGTNNIQRNSDPHFNSESMNEIRQHANQRIQSNGCGSVVTLPLQKAKAVAPDVCNVPLGNYFQLRGDSLNTDGMSFFTWERSDTGYEDFDSDSLGAFRSFTPTKSKSRFFPNLHTINFGDEDRLKNEKLPTEERRMEFRFVERTIYDSTATVPDFEETLVGHYDTAVTEVNFVDLPSLKINTLSQKTLSATQIVSVSWNEITDSSLVVEVLIAENTMSQTSSFDYERDVKELDWISVGRVPIVEGQAEIVIPASLDGKEVNIMLKSSFSDDSEACFFFDLVTNLRVGEIESKSSFIGSKKSTFALGGALFAAAVIFGIVAKRSAKKISDIKPIVQQESNFVSEHEQRTAPKEVNGTKNPMVADLIF